jgi:hypothetical protein
MIVDNERFYEARNSVAKKYMSEENRDKVNSQIINSYYVEEVSNENEGSLLLLKEEKEEYKLKYKIGTLSEKNLHAVLKQYFEPRIENQEVKIGRYIADIVSENKIIEIQTKAFNLLRNKLDAFLALEEITDVTVVYPIAKTKWLCWIDKDTGEITKKRKSPKIGKIHDSFFELYKIKQQLTNPKLNFCFVLLDITEYRYLNGWNTDKKRGSSRCEGIPNDIEDIAYIRSINDYIQFLPESLPVRFTTKDYAKHTKLSLKSSQTALNVLNYVGAVKRVGKLSNMHLYEICL